MGLCREMGLDLDLGVDRRAQRERIKKLKEAMVEAQSKEGSVETEKTTKPDASDEAGSQSAPAAETFDFPESGFVSQMHTMEDELQLDQEEFSFTNLRTGRQQRLGEGEADVESHQRGLASVLNLNLVSPSTPEIPPSSDSGISHESQSSKKVQSAKNEDKPKRELRSRNVKTAKSADSIDPSLQTLPSAKIVHPNSSSIPHSCRIFLILLAFRIFNAFLLRTYQDPDEHWQSLEVAYEFVTGSGWLTWEWSHQLRGFAHPGMFAAVWTILEELNLSDEIMVC